MRCPRKSVGAIVRAKDARILCVYRWKYPKGLGLPAGHLEKNERPEDALARELREETGLIAKNFKLVLHRDIRNECSRLDKKGKNFNLHEWWVYEVTKWDGIKNPKLKEPGKHLFVKFLPLSEIEKYAAKIPRPVGRPHSDFDPAWIEILTSLKILPASHGC